MPKLYLTNDSYPELRDVAQWARTVTWWNAIRRAFGDARFWAFLASQAACLAALVATAGAVESALDPASPVRPFVHAAAALGWLCAFAWLQVSWGGDIMRSHLRAVSPVARWACPGCGHSLVGHVGKEEATERRSDGATKGGEESAAAPAPIRCPECAAMIGREVFEPPYRIPREFRAFPPWRSA
jgi:rubredoxin